MLMKKNSPPKMVKLLSNDSFPMSLLPLSLWIKNFWSLLKHQYWMKVLEEPVLQDDDGTSIIDIVKGINMLPVSKMIAVSWNEIKQQTSRLPWRPLEDNDEECQEDHLELDTNPFAVELYSYFQVLGDDLVESDIRSGCKLMQMTMVILT